MTGKTYTTRNGTTNYESRRESAKKLRSTRVERGIYLKGNRYQVANKYGKYGSFKTLEEAQVRRDEVMPGGRGYASRSEKRSGS